MIIHTVNSGDTVFNIARRYGTSPQKIIENNRLLNPDRLTVGEKLLIINPTRTYTVRGGDRLEDITERFGITEGDLKRKNPQLGGGDTLYPGQILTIRTAEPIYGLGIANGYCYKGATAERVKEMLPYLSYLTIGGARVRSGRVEEIFDADKTVKAAKENRVKPILRVYDPEVSFTEKEREEIIKRAEDGGFLGITLALYRGMKEARAVTEEHVRALRGLAAAHGMKVFLELDGNGDHSHGDVADGYILFYDKCGEPGIPSFASGEEVTFEKYAGQGGAEKTFIDLSTAAVAGEEWISKDEAIKIAEGSGARIDYDPETMVSSFEYKRYRGGKRDSVRVAFLPPENIKAKLRLMHELGFMGIAFDIMNIPTEYLLIFDELYKIPEGHPDM